MAGRSPSREERNLWRHIVKDVAPLKRVKRRAEAPAEPKIDTPPAEPPAPARPRRAAPAARVAKLLPKLAPGDTPSIDRRTADKLRGGRLDIEAKLDLHGLTQEEAHQALSRFIARAQDKGKRMILVITGKGARGAGTAGGILKEAVPRWLNEPGLRPRVLSFSHAQPRDGGAGALYLLLKRVR